MSMKMETENNKHNGWTNYATWRINLEIFDGYDPEGQEVDHDYCQEFAEELVLGTFCDSCELGESTSLAHSYAYAFMSDVNWHEIAENLNEQ